MHVEGISVTGAS